MPTQILQTQQFQGELTGNPVPWPEGKTSYAITGLMSDGTAGNASNSMTFTALASFDGGLTFLTGPSAQWVGGSMNRSGDAFARPAIGEGYTPDAVPTHINLRMNSAGIISAGAVVDFN